MLPLKFKIDAAAIAAQFKSLKMEVEQDIIKGVEVLARATKEHLMLQAEEELTSSTWLKFEKCVDIDESNPGVWIISIDKDALWIEEGLDPHDMKPDLLKGRSHRVIPFDYGKPPSQMSSSQKTGYTKKVRAKIQAALKKEGVPWKKLETYLSGPQKGQAIHGGINPNTGRGIPKLLHSFDFGGGIPGKGNTQVMKGVNIYQTITKSGNVRRDIMTFRTVSSGPASEGKWMHPGLKAKKFLDQAEEFARKEWEQTVLPQILDKYK